MYEQKHRMRIMTKYDINMTIWTCQNNQFYITKFTTKRMLAHLNNNNTLVILDQIPVKMRNFPLILYVTED